MAISSFYSFIIRFMPILHNYVKKKNHLRIFFSETWDEIIIDPRRLLLLLPDISNIVCRHYRKCRFKGNLNSVGHNAANFNNTNKYRWHRLIKHKKTTTYDVANPSPGLGQVKKSVAGLNWLMWSQLSPPDKCISNRDTYKQTIANLYIFASTLKDHIQTYYDKNEWQHKQWQYRSWWGVLDRTLCDKSWSVTCGTSIVYSGYSGFLHQ